MVPADVFDNYKYQNYVTKDNKVSDKVPLVIQQHVEQWVLKVDLQAAVRSGSPGILY